MDNTTSAWCVAMLHGLGKVAFKVNPKEFDPAKVMKGEQSLPNQFRVTKLTKIDYQVGPDPKAPKEMLVQRGLFRYPEDEIGDATPPVFTREVVLLIRLPLEPLAKALDNFWNPSAVVTDMADVRQDMARRGIKG